MALPRNHRLRRALWRLNGVLVLTVAAVAWSVLSSPDPLAERPHRDWAAEAAPPERPMWRPPERGKALAEFMPVFHHFYPPAPPVTEAPVTVPTRLPLRAFEIGMVWHDEERGYFVMLDSKDPAHDEKYFFGPDPRDRDAELLGVRTDATRLYASVRRGEESFEFSTPLRSGGFVRTDIIRLLAEGEEPPKAGPHGPTHTYIDGRPALKGVPFYEKGRVVGLRITGVRPNSWAVEMGLQRGDVIRKIDEAAVSDAKGTKTRLRTGKAPNSLAVTRGTNQTPVTLSRG